MLRQLSQGLPCPPRAPPASTSPEGGASSRYFCNRKRAFTAIQKACYAPDIVEGNVSVERRGRNTDTQSCLYQNMYNHVNTAVWRTMKGHVVTCKGNHTTLAALTSQLRSPHYGQMPTTNAPAYEPGGGWGAPSGPRGAQRASGTRHRAGSQRAGAHGRQRSPPNFSVFQGFFVICLLSVNECDNTEPEKQEEHSWNIVAVPARRIGRGRMRVGGVLY